MKVHKINENQQVYALWWEFSFLKIIFKNLFNAGMVNAFIRCEIFRKYFYIT